jgi:zinc protease
MKIDVKKHILENGLTVLILKRDFVPKVSMQLWYNVGSKHEKDENRGIAHMIEHMIFKGTKNLPEGAIDKIVYELSGSCNAFTSFDYTGYIFDMPSANYKHIIKIMADCMQNALFDQECLNSELKAVFQELRMYRDSNITSMAELSMKSLFPDHPYSNPIIGYKDRIWNFNSKQLKDFYKKYYHPKNAVLVIVGDVDEKDCIDCINENFKSIKSNENKNEIKKFFHERDLISSNNTIFKDIENTHVLMAFEIPGLSIPNIFIYEALNVFLGVGRGSLLYKKLVYELQLVNEIESFVYELIDYSVFYIYYVPKKIEDTEKIEEIIFKEIDKLKNKEYSDELIERAFKTVKMENISLQEDNHKLCSYLGYLYVATGDENSLEKSLECDFEKLKNSFKFLVEEYLNKLFLKKTKIIPLSDSEKDYWKKLQEEKDKNDELELSKIERKEESARKNFEFKEKIEKPSYLNFPDFTRYNLKNGLTFYNLNIDLVDKVEIFIDFKVKHYFDPKDFAGRLNLMFDLMEEGTKKFPGNTFGEKIELLGINFEVGSGSISLSCLPEDIEKAFIFLSEYILDPEFSEIAFNRIKEQQISEIKNFWDDANSFSNQLIRELVYKEHPYGKNPSGTIKTISSVSLSNIKEAYKKFITSKDTVIVVCGPIKENIIFNLIEKYFNFWEGPSVDSILLENPKLLEKEIVHHEINRDQVVLSYGGLSVSRFDKKYDSIMIFDQTFGGGVSGSMNNRLFSLREETGLFYAIRGSLVSGCYEHPGMIHIKAITSTELISKAEDIIEATINNILVGLTDKEIEKGKEVIVNSFVDLISNYRSIASTIIFMHKFNLNKDYFKDRTDKIFSITKNEIISAVEEITLNKGIVKLTVGRK